MWTGVEFHKLSSTPKAISVSSQTWLSITEQMANKFVTSAKATVGM